MIQSAPRPDDSRTLWLLGCERHDWRSVTDALAARDHLVVDAETGACVIGPHDVIVMAARGSADNLAYWSNGAFNDEIAARNWIAEALRAAPSNADATARDLLVLARTDVRDSSLPAEMPATLEGLLFPLLGFGDPVDFENWRLACEIIRGDLAHAAAAPIVALAEAGARTADQGALSEDEARALAELCSDFVVTALRNAASRMRGKRQRTFAAPDLGFSLFRAAAVLIAGEARGVVVEGLAAPMASANVTAQAALAQIIGSIRASEAAVSLSLTGDRAGHCRVAISTDWRQRRWFELSAPARASAEDGLFFVASSKTCQIVGAAQNLAIGDSGAIDLVCPLSGSHEIEVVEIGESGYELRHRLYFNGELGIQHPPPEVSGGDDASSATGSRTEAA